MKINTPRLILACLLCVSAFSGQAATLQLTAEYKPSISSPSHVSFTNTTPLSGYCQQHPTYCPEGVASIVIPGLEATKQFTNVTEDIRKHIYVKLDSRPKNIVLTNRITGQAIEVNFRLSVVAMQLAGDVSGYILNAGRLPEGGCQAGIETGSDTAYNFAWTFPANVQECYRRLKEDVHVDRVLSLSGISVGYEMSVDSPAGVYNGVYEGELVYSVGDNGDIDFGADTYSDSVLKIQIQAKVEHAFHLQFPPGSERLVLAPEGGWAKWLNSGQQPTRLGRDLDFFLTATGPFSVQLQCQPIHSQHCGLRHEGDVVPIETKLTLPALSSITDEEVKEFPLRVGMWEPFHVGTNPVFSKRSTLHMWVERSGVETMFRQPGSTWRGRVILQFDAEL
ncbi:hypothetical protein ACK31U_14045 [Aeromonas caviae]|uniref:hypothetical protein n=1 Tax=Aeromonas caviae TaxID=648 RepID=UPI00191DC1C4|nr:hypothetical protein [Aeromonas caviae]MBL0654487.1 hypothetical protein [Aeromonas caviae]